MLRHDNGEPMTVKQVCDEAWNQFGPGAILAELAGRIGWNGKFYPDMAESLSKDCEAVAMIAERLRQWEAKEDFK